MGKQKSSRRRIHGEMHGMLATKLTNPLSNTFWNIITVSVWTEDQALINLFHLMTSYNSGGKF